MRLLHARDFRFEEFDGDKRPANGYAILSHRWTGDEVIDQEMKEERNHLLQSSRVEKIRRFCSIACFRNFEWVWIDTCCIDKTNSAELSEAINSMWRWYREAEKCYVYLDDVHAQSSDDCDWRKQMKASK